MFHIVFQCLYGILVNWLWLLNLLGGCVDFFELGKICVDHVGMIAAVFLVTPGELSRFHEIALKRCNVLFLHLLQYTNSELVSLLFVHR